MNLTSARIELRRLLRRHWWLLALALAAYLGATRGSVVYRRYKLEKEFRAGLSSPGTPPDAPSRQLVLGSTRPDGKFILYSSNLDRRLAFPSLATPMQDLKVIDRETGFVTASIDAPRGMLLHSVQLFSESSAVGVALTDHGESETLNNLLGWRGGMYALLDLRSGKALKIAWHRRRMKVFPWSSVSGARVAPLSHMVTQRFPIPFARHPADVGDYEDADYRHIAVMKTDPKWELSIRRISNARRINTPGIVPLVPQPTKSDVTTIAELLHLDTPPARAPNDFGRSLSLIREDEDYPWLGEQTFGVICFYAERSRRRRVDSIPFGTRSMNGDQRVYTRRSFAPMDNSWLLSAFDNVFAYVKPHGSSDTTALWVRGDWETQTTASLVLPAGAEPLAILNEEEMLIREAVADRVVRWPLGSEALE